MDQKIEEVMQLFDEEICRYTKYHLPGRWGYAASSMTPPSIDEIRNLTGKQKPLFIEFGCGPGRNTLLAGMLGFKAYGIDIRLDLIEHGNQYIESLKSQGIADSSVSAKLYYGNMMTKDLIRDLKDFWITFISKKLNLNMSEARTRLQTQMKSSLDFLSEDEIKRIFKYTPKKSIRIQRFEVYSDSWPFTETVDKELLEVTPPFILENPYEGQGLDVYDVMERKFEDFDYFYSYSYHEDRLIAEMIRRHHPKPYYWQEKGFNKSLDTSKFPSIDKTLKVWLDSLDTGRNF